MGQDLSRAVGAGMPKEGQVDAYTRSYHELTLKGLGLDNEIKATNLARLRNELLAKPAPPPLAMPGGPRFHPGPQASAQKVQDQYGDIVENVYGVPSLIYDSFTNLDRLMGGKFLGSPWKVRSGPLPRGKPSARPSVSNSR